MQRNPSQAITLGTIGMMGVLALLALLSGATGQIEWGPMRAFTLLLTALPLFFLLFLAIRKRR